MPETTLPELVGICSKLVPGFPTVRADADGRLWQWDGTQWAPISRGRSKHVVLRDTTGVKRDRNKARLICAAWHGECRGNLSVGFRDGNSRNLKPDNLHWHRTQTGFKSRLSADDRDRIRNRVAGGGKLRSVAREFGISDSTVCRICQSDSPDGASVASRRWLNADDRREIFRLSRTGLKHADIARRFRRSVHWVRQVIYRERAREEAERGKQS